LYFAKIFFLWNLYYTNTVFLLVFFLFSSITLYLLQRTKAYKITPIYNPSDVNPVVDSTVQYISNILLIFVYNQNGKQLRKRLWGKIYVADFFFTTCTSICPKMTSNLVDVQKAISNNPKVMLLSHCFPRSWQRCCLKAYAIEKGVDDKKWNLVTGDKKEIYAMARKSYLAVKWVNPKNCMTWFIPKICFSWCKKKS
jgi:protein SCO1/2